jgi:hypothetical protein
MCTSVGLLCCDISHRIGKTGHFIKVRKSVSIMKPWPTRFVLRSDALKAASVPTLKGVSHRRKTGLRRKTSQITRTLPLWQRVGRLRLHSNASGQLHRNASDNNSDQKIDAEHVCPEAPPRYSAARRASILKTTSNRASASRSAVMGNKAESVDN